MRSYPPGSSSALVFARPIRRVSSSGRSSMCAATRTQSSRRRTSSPRPTSTSSNSCSSSSTTGVVAPRWGSSRSTATRTGAAPCPRASNRASRARRVHPPARAESRRSYPPLLRLGAMKGIVLPGGTATRLFPLTIVTNKHLLPIYDRPMIYYPIETLAGMASKEVVVIVGGKSVGDVVELLADVSHFGLDLTYRYQHGAYGIAHAIGLARSFVGDDSLCCVPGGNLPARPGPP